MFPRRLRTLLSAMRCCARCREGVLLSGYARLLPVAMLETELLSDLLRQKQPLVALLAPSFPVMYSYPHIVGKIRRLGFAAVVEVAVGGAKTNAALVAA